ncbi:CBS domain-containing protein [Bdellovibrionota bacterium FG-2]
MANKAKKVPTFSSLTPLVRDLMTPAPLTLSEENCLKDVEDLFNWKAIRHIPIINATGRLVGLVTHRDFLKLAISRLAAFDAEEAEALYRSVKVHTIMGKNLKSASPDMPLRVAADLMFHQKYGCLPVVDGKTLVGILTEADFVKAFMKWDLEYASNSTDSKIS